jgi:hypothetical protein
VADIPYLVALALCEFDGQRALPLTGRSRGASATPDTDPGAAGRELALELLLRLWQRSDDGSLRRAAGDVSLLLVELPLEKMSEQLPLLKANWVKGCGTPALLEGLQALAIRGWTLSIARYEEVRFQAWPAST